MTSGIIFSIKEFTLHDGPGIRSTVFLKGCPLRCAWCHNPEGLHPEPQLMIKHGQCVHCGKCMGGCAHEACAPFDRCTKVCPLGCMNIVGERVAADALAERLLRNRSFFEPEGGITLSGGEPLMQPDFSLALLVALRPVHRAVETSGFAAPAHFAAMAQEADLVLMDLKHMDGTLHKRYTGVDNAPILRNLAQLKATGKSFIIRVPLIRDVNDDVGNLAATAAVLADCKDRVQVELLPYNTLAGAKYADLGLSYPLADATPSAAADACAPFLAYDINVIQHTA